MKKITTIILIVVSTVCYSQSLSLSVISSTGGFDKTDNISLEWTLGESFIETLTDENIIFTQGFQQSFSNRILGINEYYTNIQVFPNPAYTQINVYFDSNSYEKLLLNLYDIHGRILIEESTLFNKNEKLIDITNFSSGLYLLNISDLEGLFIESHKIIKF